MKRTKILTTGANGRTGPAILQASARYGPLTRAIIRNGNPAAKLLEIGAIEAAVADFLEEDSLAAAMKGVDKVLHIGPPMHPDEVELSECLNRLAKQNSVLQFI